MNDPSGFREMTCADLLQGAQAAAAFGIKADDLVAALERFADAWRAALDPEQEIQLIQLNPGLNFIQKARLIREIRKLNK